MNKINYELEGQLIQYQIIQKDYELFEVLTVLDDFEYELYFSEIVQERMRERLGEEIEIKVRIFGELLPSEKTGKIACFMSEVR